MLVNDMTQEASAHPTAPETHWMFSKLGLSWKSFAMAVPQMAARVLPMMEFRGCARGDLIVLKSRTALAPMEAMITGGCQSTMPGA